MFLDELKLTVRAGRGGDGAVHFARSKYQPFAGPDGGDGGPGGDAVLIGRRDVDALDHLLRLRLRAQDGAPGGGSLKTGARGADLELIAPLGTLAYRIGGGAELGCVTAGGERLVLARGGTGGRGNPHFASGGRRTPRQAEPGGEGEQRKVELRYRLFADTALIEPVDKPDRCLLPKLLGRDPGEVDFALFQRKPRWVRVEHDYRRYDVAYLPLAVYGPEDVSAPLLHHLYWAQAAFINLRPLGKDAAACWEVLRRELDGLRLRRLKALVCCAATALFEPFILETEEGEAEVTTRTARSKDDTLARLRAQLVGGTVD